jgi:hypothetical protein
MLAEVACINSVFICKGMERYTMVTTYWDTVREHLIGYALKLRIVLLSSGLAFQIICQEVIQHSKGEYSFNLFEARREQSRVEKLLMFLHSFGTYAIKYLQTKDARLVNHCQER